MNVNEMFTSDCDLESIVDVAGFAVPQLIHHDDRLWVVEMGIVSPPFVLDFAGAYLDLRPIIRMT
jgi:hypothetical protein